MSDITPFEKSVLIGTTYWKILRSKTKDQKEKICKKSFDPSKKSLIQIALAAEMLPSDVWRRWLRWSNTDFQGFDLFLKRINSEQAESLKKHAEAFLLGTKKEDMPCYKDGLRNKFWKCVEFFVSVPVEDKQEKYTESKAIAHDFFGFGFGFTSYANEEQNEPTNKSVVRDLLRNDKDKGFEVNQEELGIYFVLYRLMRKNALWGQGTVKLSPYICPGFWITLLGWFSFLVLSPLSLFAAALSNGWQFGMFLAFGAITPMILFYWGLTHMLRKTSYNENFWLKIITVGGLCAASMGVTLVVLEIIAINSFTLFLLVGWLLIMYAHGKSSLFRLPVLSKLFSALMPVMIYLDATRYASFMKLLVDIYQNILFPVLGLVLGVAIFMTIQAVINSKADESLEKRYELFRKMKVFMYFLAAIFVALLWFTPAKGFGLPLNLDLTIALFAFVLFVGIIGYTGNKDPYKKEVEEFIEGKASSRVERRLNRLFVNSLASNKNLFPDGSCFSYDFGYDLFHLINSFIDSDDVQVKELQDFFANARSVEAVNYLADMYFIKAGRTFWHSGHLYQTLYSNGLKLEEIAEVWQANGCGTYTNNGHGYITLNEEVKPIKIDQEVEVKEFKENKFLAKLGDTSEAFAAFIAYLLLKVWNFVTYVPIKFYVLWKLFNEKCPKIDEVKVCS